MRVVVLWKLLITQYAQADDILKFIETCLDLMVSAERQRKVSPAGRQLLCGGGLRKGQSWGKDRKGQRNTRNRSA